MPRPLRITNPTTDVAVLNKWAEEVNTELHGLKNVGKFVATKASNASITNITNNTVTGATDGLVHGDAVWEYDSAYTNFRDDFLYSSTTIGDLSWFLSTNGTNTARSVVGAFPNMGVV